jgi:hypothetical protein
MNKCCGCGVVWVAECWVPVLVHVECRVWMQCVSVVARCECGCECEWCFCCGTYQDRGPEDLLGATSGKCFVVVDDDEVVLRLWCWMLCDKWLSACACECRCNVWLVSVAASVALWYLPRWPIGGECFVVVVVVVVDDEVVLWLWCCMSGCVCVARVRVRFASCECELRVASASCKCESVSCTLHKGQRTKEKGQTTKDEGQRKKDHTAASKNHSHRPQTTAHRWMPDTGQWCNDAWCNAICNLVSEAFKSGWQHLNKQ